MQLGGRRRREQQALRLRAARTSLAVGILVLAVKAAAFAWTGSAAILSDAAESLVNVMASALLVYTLVVAARPADRDHPYGHGKAEYFSAGAEGALIAVAGVAILADAVPKLLRGAELRHLDGGLALVAGAAVANAALAAYLIRTGRRTGSLALVADGEHLRTDVVTSLGVLLGLGVVRLTGFTAADPLVAIAVALHILATGLRLVRRAVGGLMDEADEELLTRIAEVLEKERRPWWIDVHSLRAWRAGALHHVDLHMSVPRYYDVDRVHEINDEVYEALRHGLDQSGDVIVHFDPCRPWQCPICTVEGCPVRSAPPREPARFTRERIRREDEDLDSGRPVTAGHG